MSLRGQLTSVKAFAVALIALSLVVPSWGAEERVTLLCTMNLGELYHGAMAASPKALKQVEGLMAGMRSSAPDALIVDLGGFYGLRSPVVMDKGDLAAHEFAQRLEYDALCLGARDVMLMGSRFGLLRRPGEPALAYVSNVARADTSRLVGESVRFFDLAGKGVEILSITQRDRLSGVRDIDRSYRFEMFEASAGPSIPPWARIVVTDAMSSGAIALAADGALEADLIIQRAPVGFSIKDGEERFGEPRFSQDARHRVPIVRASGCAGVLRVDVLRDSKGKLSFKAQFESIGETALEEERKVERLPAFLAERVAGAPLPEEQAPDLVRKVLADSLVTVSEWVGKGDDDFVCANDRVYGYSAYGKDGFIGRLFRVKQTSVDGKRTVECLVVFGADGSVTNLTFIAPPYVGGGFLVDTDRLLGLLIGRRPSSLPERLEGMGGADEFAVALVDQLRFLERMGPAFTGIEPKR